MAHALAKRKPHFIPPGADVGQKPPDDAEAEEWEDYYMTHLEGVLSKENVLTPGQGDASTKPLGEDQLKVLRAELPPDVRQYALRKVLRRAASANAAAADIVTESACAHSYENACNCVGC